MENFNDKQFNESLSSEDRKLQSKISLQLELAKRHNEKFEDFIANDHAKKFGEYIEKHPELLDKFDKNPEEALKEAENIVYH